MEQFTSIGTVVAMTAKVERMSKVVEDGGTTDVDVIRSSPIPPAMVVDGKGIVVVAKKDILDGDILAAHHVEAITPRMTRETTHITNCDIFGLSTKHGIVLRIDDRETIYFHIFRIRNLHATKRVEKHTPTNNTDILCPIYDESGTDHSSRSNIDCGTTRYLNLSTWQVVGLMDSRSEIDETRMLDKNIMIIECLPIDIYFRIRIGCFVHFLFSTIHEEMKTMFSVAIDIHFERIATIVTHAWHSELNG